MPRCVRTRWPLAAAALGITANCLAAGPVARFVERPGIEEFSGRLIVRPRQGLAPNRDAQARARLAPLAMERCAATDEYLVRAPVLDGERGAGENDLAARLMASGDYEYATPDWRCYLQCNTPNDPGEPQQWHHATMNSTAAWDLCTGASSVIVALVDTGIDLTHPDLMTHRVSGYNSVDRLAESAGGQVADLNGHGTHTAGCAAAVGNNGMGVTGMGWALSVMMVRTSNDSWGTALLWDITDGARWAVDHGARAVNVSYAGVDSPTVQTTGAYIRSQGGLLVFAADNSATNWVGFDWPDVVIVGATDRNDARASFSSYGPAVDLFAPGVGIYSTAKGGGYQLRDGTSMAAPLVAGLASVIWSVSPSFTSQQVETFIESTCVDIGTPGNDDVFGWGRIDAFSAVKKAVGATGPQPPTALPDAVQAVGGVPELIDVMANDYDVNGDSFKLSLLTESSALGASIARSRGTGPGGRDEVQYVAPVSVAGLDTFKYLITDTTGRSATGTVTVQVTPHCPADINNDGFVTGEDFDLFMAWFLAGDKRADANRDGFVNGTDFDVFMASYDAGC